MEERQVLGRIGRALGAGLLVIAALLYLQFALQALFAAPIQAILVLMGAVAFGAATVRFIRHQDVAQMLFVGTLPLFLFSLATMFIYSDESPVFAVIFGVAPALSGTSLLLARRGSGTDRRPQAI
ncbi:MAG: hypothetical protein QOG16_1131 [Actinomycetota bacterium]|jgi:hypothetical protein|nr:hypothetical protein [Actinomycetota bacterium]